MCRTAWARWPSTWNGRAVLRLAQVTIVGQDMGALVGLLVAAQRPERSAELALLEPLDPDDRPGPHSSQRYWPRSRIRGETPLGSPCLIS